MKGGQLAAINLESKAAELAARQVNLSLLLHRHDFFSHSNSGLAHAASRYLGLRSVMMILGPV
ncbi:hypothetical protein BHE74_00028672 [Ensete ventricosum]|nr:hypothetical protein BHE74_00028672 [Ensete ventricosum]